MTTRRGRTTTEKTEQTVSSTEYINMVKDNAALRTANKELTDRLVTVEDKYKSKPMWKSKTIIFNVSALIAYLATVGINIDIPPDLLLTVVSVGNAILRYITKGEVTLS